MKKTLSFLFLYLVSAIQLFSQSRDEVYNKTEMVWYGLDFTKAKMIGSEGFENPLEVKNKYFGGWNYLVLNEPEKFDLKKAFGKQEITKDLTVVEKKNAAVNATDLVINKDYSFEKSEVSKIIKSYKTDQKKGLGLVFIVESFNKFQEKGTVYVTFFDIATKKVLLTEKVSGKAFGFGIRNHWGGAINNIIKQSEKDFLSWQKSS
jgi:hypothetical protein